MAQGRQLELGLLQLLRVLVNDRDKCMGEYHLTLACILLLAKMYGSGTCHSNVMHGGLDGTRGAVSLEALSGWFHHSPLFGLASSLSFAWQGP